MTHHDPKVVAEGLSEGARDLWIRTVLTIICTEPQRLAFIAGYNGDPLPRHFSSQMLDKHNLGKAVRASLQDQKR